MLPEQSAQSSVLLTDLYQLTMVQAYLDHGMEERAVFEFFVRKLPPQRNFLVAAGLEQVIKFLEDVRFTPQELEWITGYGPFRPNLVSYLERFRFTGDVHALAGRNRLFPERASIASYRSTPPGPARRQPPDQPAPLPDPHRL